MAPAEVVQDASMSRQAILAWSMVFGCLALYVGGMFGMDDPKPDFATETILPVLVLVGAGWALSRLVRGETRWWLVPAAAFLAGAAIVLVAWSDHVEDPRLEEDCTKDRFLPAAFGETMLGVSWALIPIVVLVALVAGASLAMRPATRWPGTWSILSVPTLLIGSWSLLMRCM
jgi:hypothetical protein